MLRPDFAAAQIAATIAQESARIALPLSPTTASAGSSNFGAFFNEVRAEVTSFIANGAAPSTQGVRAPALSAEGFAQVTRLQQAEAGASKEQQQSFVASVAPLARQVAARLGVDPELVTAHAALESGWGQRALQGVNGGASHNLFGIKAGANWSGEVAQALTTEFVDGVAEKRTESFRSYGDAASAFGDYARLLASNPRFQNALNVGDDATAFARALVQGSYATDPAYAQKIESVVRQVRELNEASAGAR